MPIYSTCKQINFLRVMLHIYKIWEKKISYNNLKARKSEQGSLGTESKGEVQFCRMLVWRKKKDENASMILRSWITNFWMPLSSDVLVSPFFGQKINNIKPEKIVKNSQPSSFRPIEIQLFPGDSSSISHRLQRHVSECLIPSSDAKTKTEFIVGWNFKSTMHVLISTHSLASFVNSSFLKTEIFRILRISSHKSICHVLYYLSLS